MAGMCPRLLVTAWVAVWAFAAGAWEPAAGTWAKQAVSEGTPHPPLRGMGATLH